MMKLQWIAVLDTVYVIDGDLVANVGPFDDKEQLVKWCNACPQLKDAEVSLQCLFQPVANDWWQP